MDRMEWHPHPELASPAVALHERIAGAGVLPDTLQRTRPSGRGAGHYGGQGGPLSPGANFLIMEWRKE